MDQKNDMICDMTTGICGPADENMPMTGFIDLSAPQDKTEKADEGISSIPPISEKTNSL